MMLSSVIHSQGAGAITLKRKILRHVLSLLMWTIGGVGNFCQRQAKTEV